MKLVIFDVDGTLFDSQDLIFRGMAMAFTAQGLTPPQKADVLQTVGLSLHVAIAWLAPEIAPDVQAQIVDSYKEVFTTSSIADSAPLFPGALECIETLAADDRIILAIATGKGRNGLLPMLDAHGLRSRFISIQTADTHPSKPHPSMLLTAMSECGIDAANTAMVGDTSFDMDMSRSAGARGLGVSWGYHAVPELRAAGAGFVADDYQQLTAEILRWAR